MYIIRLIYILFFSFCFQYNSFGKHKSIKQLEKQFNFDYAIQVIDSALTQAELQLGKQSITYGELLYEKVVIYEAFNKNKEAFALVETLKSRTLSPYLNAKLDIELSLILLKSPIFGTSEIISTIPRSVSRYKFLIFEVAYLSYYY